MRATCLVSATDYHRHWLGGAVSAAPARPSPYPGPERRHASDRRIAHDRRWDGSRGRRFRLRDRRRNDATNTLHRGEQ